MLIQRGALIVAVALLIVYSGCAESTRVRSLPAGSKVFINDTFVGLTPLSYSVPRDEFDREFQVSVEHPGYETAHGMLRKDVCRGRIVGGVFTLGILLLFKGPECFAGVQDFALRQLPAEQTATARDGAPSVETRLQRLDKMREQGTISEEEFRRYREAILQDL